MKLNEAVGKRLKVLLEEKQWKNYSLQKEGGVPRSTVGLIIGAKRKTVKLETLYQITSTLGISLKEFFDDPIFNEVTD